MSHSIAMESSREPKLPQYQLHTSYWSDDFEAIYKGGDLANGKRVNSLSRYVVATTTGIYVASTRWLLVAVLQTVKSTD